MHSNTYVTLYKIPVSVNTAIWIWIWPYGWLFGAWIKSNKKSKLINMTICMFGCLPLFLAIITEPIQLSTIQNTLKGWIHRLLFVLEINTVPERVVITWRSRKQSRVHYLVSTWHENAHFMLILVSLGNRSSVMNQT